MRISNQINRLFTAIILCALTAGAQLSFAEGIGWRGDGTGNYPDATPVTEWSIETNVIWSTEMPGMSNATPVPVGDKLFVCTEPSTLICVNAADGEILWQAANEYTDVAEGDELADMEQKQAEYNQLRRELAKSSKELRNLGKNLQDDPDNADLKAQVQQLKQTVGDQRARMAAMLELWYVKPPTHGTNGYTSATPVSDGEHVWALFGNGIAACYDLEGNRVWALSVGTPQTPTGWGHSASPILAGGYLITHTNSMKALDPATGETVWEAPIRTYWGTPVVTTIEDTPVIITPNGYAINATDGTILAEKMGTCTYCAPLINDGIVYFAADGLWRAVKLPETLDPFEVEQVWQVKPKKDRYYGSPVIHEGIIYGVVRSQFLSALDLATGEVLYEQNLTMGKGQCYPSPTIAGGQLFIGCDNGEMVVVQPGATFEEIGRNSLETFRACPVFVGGRMYIRGYDNLYCIGAE